MILRILFLSFFLSFPFSIFASTELPSFSKGKFPAPSSYYWRTNVGDIDKDGDLDIFLSNVSGASQLWVNNGKGFFTQVSIPGMPSSVSSLFVDLDRDGDLDILLGRSGSEMLSWWENDGNLHFTKHVIDSQVGNGTYLAVSDIDKDGDLDIYLVSRSNGGNYFYIQGPNLSFSRMSVSGDTNPSNFAKFVDIDGDGDLDIYVPSYNNSNNYFLINDGLGNGVSSFHKLNISGNDISVYDALFFDIDKDGDLDILNPDGGNGDALKILINDGGRDNAIHFHFEQLPGSIEGSGMHIALCDLNKDGRKDLFLTRWSRNSVVWIQDDFERGIQSFHPFSFPKSSDPSIESYIVDLNGDGREDIFRALYPGKAKIWFQKRPERTLSSRTRFVCRDPKAINYSPFGRHRASYCHYPVSKKKCSFSIHNFMKYGDRDGKYSSYNKGIVHEVKLLQSHINRILRDEYGSEASGPEDGIFGPLTKRGVMRLQKRLNEILKGILKKPLVIDGIVGPFTREAIRLFCDQK